MKNNNNNDSLQNISPLIFIKKANTRQKIIPLNLTVNTLGPVKHFPPATKEWFNSIYAYNNNSIKNLNIADKNLSRLIKSYFNFYLSNKDFRSKGLATRFRRLAINKIFVSKAELKHTSSKVIITLYVYNEEERVLRRKIEKLTNILFPSDNILYYKNLWKKSRPFSFFEKKAIMINEYNNTPLLSWIFNNINSNLNKLMTEREIYPSINNKEKKDNLAKREIYINKLESWINYSIYSTSSAYAYAKQNEVYWQYLLKVYLGKRQKIILYYKLLLNLNRNKFKDLFISKLKGLVSEIYGGKQVEFKIVSLKTLYFNSDIFTQAIALKLKNRDNRLLRVLRSALYLVKLPRVNRIREKFNKTIIAELWGNRVKNLKVNSILTNTATKYNSDKDLINKLLLDLFSNSFINAGNSNKVIDTKDVNPSTNTTIDNKPNNIEDFILNNLKHKHMAGVRLEAKGRLTRRFTASRSVFKIRWKGGIKNIDSSYRGLSSVILRGHLKSNVQYSMINSKTRNGAFGLKGWISSK